MTPIHSGKEPAKASQKKIRDTTEANGSVLGASDRYLTVKQAVKYLNCSKSYLDKLRCTGGGPPYTRLGRKILYRRSERERIALVQRFLLTAFLCASMYSGTCSA